METKLISPQLVDILKTLVQQVSLKEISTRDFVCEMESLYGKVELLESDKRKVEANLEASTKKEILATENLNSYKREFVEPSIKLKELEKKLLDGNKDWQLEKKYLQNENRLLKEILANITALRNISQYNSQGGGYNETTMRPNL